jgi:hypothetical protein
VRFAFSIALIDASKCERRDPDLQIKLADKVEREGMTLGRRGIGI